MNGPDDGRLADSEAGDRHDIRFGMFRVCSKLFAKLECLATGVNKGESERMGGTVDDQRDVGGVV